MKDLHKQIAFGVVNAVICLMGIGVGCIALIAGDIIKGLSLILATFIFALVFIFP